MPVEFIYTNERVIDQPATANAARKLRKASGASMTAIAKEMGISQSQIYYLESAKRKWTEKTFKQYAEACATCATFKKNEQPT